MFTAWSYIRFLYNQPWLCDMHNCCAQLWPHEIAERRVFHGHGWWPSSVSLSRTASGRRWREMCCGTTAYALTVSYWLKAHVASSGDKTQQQSKEIYGECVTQSDAHRHDAECVELCAFEKNYGIRSVDVRTMDIVEEMISSNVLPANSKATYIRYITVVELRTKHHGVLTFLVKLSKVCSAETALGITHLDDSSLYNFSEVDIFLMTRPADVSVKNDHTPDCPRKNSVYGHIWSLLDELQIRYLEQDKANFLFIV